MPARRISLHLDLDLASQPIEGELRTDGGLRLPFSGWLGLTAALEHATGQGPDPTTTVTPREDIDVP